MRGVAHVEAILASLREWEEPFVENAIFGTDDARRIAQAVSAFCLDHLGASVAGAFFVRASIGSVHALALDDGRRVVLKAHQPNVGRSELEAMQRVQDHLAQRGFPVPRPLVPPAPLGRGHATVEELLVRGARADPHDRPVLHAMATAFAEMIAAAAPFASDPRLPKVLAPPEDGLWPQPHTRLVDFEATAAGATYIDSVAEQARIALRSAAGKDAAGHADWRMEHLRFEGDPPRIVASYDWDSVRRAPEPALLGIVLHAFAADWDLEGRCQAPGLDEAREFVAVYERARCAAFDKSERVTMSASFAYGCAYTARCCHALNPTGPRDDFRELVAREGAALLAL